MNLGAIKKISEKREGGLKKLAADIGMSEQNLHRCIRNNKIQAADLENIALLLKVDIRVFFDEEILSLPNNLVETKGDFSPASMNGNVTVGTDAVLTERVKSLELALIEKDERISEFKERIEELKERIIELKK